MSGIPLKYVDKATFPNNVTLERVEDKFLLRCGDYVWDWGLYQWTERWTYDCARPEGERERDCRWFHGRYLVPEDKIQNDFHGGDDYPYLVNLAFGGLTPLERPSWFRETVSR